MTAACMDDDEWRARVERGQKLAREAEGRRRSLRDAQRSAEDTIAEQAAELEKLREEAKSRRVGRRALRAQDVRLRAALVSRMGGLLSSCVWTIYTQARACLMRAARSGMQASHAKYAWVVGAELMCSAIVCYSRGFLQGGKGGITDDARLRPACRCVVFAGI